MSVAGAGARAGICVPHAACRTVGVAVNTSHLFDDEANLLLDSIEGETGLPSVDPLRQGAARLVDAL